MNFKDINEIVASIDMDAQQLMLLALLNNLGAERIYEILTETADFLRRNGRDNAADILEEAAANMLA